MQIHPRVVRTCLNGVRCGSTRSKRPRPRWRVVRSARCLMAAAVGALALATPALAVPPRNDNYLSSTIMRDARGNTPSEFRDAVDTAEATTQADLFDPSQEGLPLGGGPPEPTRCGSTDFGKTVWYDFAPKTSGGVQITAGGFNAVVAVYEWDPTTSLIKRPVACRDDSAGPVETLLVTVKGERAYTVQIGGAGGVGGPLDYRFTFFPDTDGDGVFDEQPDKCPDTPGIAAAGGCPPELRATPSLSYDRLSSGIRVRRLTVDRVPKGARLEARCRRCGVRQVLHAKRAGLVKFTRFAGRVAPSGARIELLVTKARSRSGRYLYGAVGNYFAWPVQGSSTGRRVTRCLPPGSRKPERCR